MFFGLMLAASAATVGHAPNCDIRVGELVPNAHVARDLAEANHPAADKAHNNAPDTPWTLSRMVRAAGWSFSTPFRQAFRRKWRDNDNGWRWRIGYADQQMQRCNEQGLLSALSPSAGCPHSTLSRHWQPSLTPTHCGHWLATWLVACNRRKMALTVILSVVAVVVFDWVFVGKLAPGSRRF